MILILRGHIRDSFNDDKLYNLIKSIYVSNPQLKIYIHTWNIIQNNISWRQMMTIDRKVTNETIYEYFRDLSHLIKQYRIDDDSKIELIGNLEGKIGKGNAPIIGWKRYWYGKYKIIEWLKNEPFDRNECIINCRFDILSNINSFSSDNITNFIEKYKNKTIYKNIFSIGNEFTTLPVNQFVGIDNIYMGNIETQYKLIEHFHNNLDEILFANSTISNQEHLVFYENNKLFLS